MIAQKQSRLSPVNVLKFLYIFHISLRTCDPTLRHYDTIFLPVQAHWADQRLILSAPEHAEKPQHNSWKGSSIRSLVLWITKHKMFILGAPQYIKWSHIERRYTLLQGNHESTMYETLAEDKKLVLPLLMPHHSIKRPPREQVHLSLLPFPSNYLSKNILPTTQPKSMSSSARPLHHPTLQQSPQRNSPPA